MLFKNPFTNAGKQGEPRKEPPKSGVIPNSDNTNLEDDPNKKKGESSDPLLDFEKLWQPNLDKDGKPIVKPGPKSFTPNIDPKAFGDFVGKLDFTKGLTAEDFEGIKKGGEEAVGSLLQILNKTGQATFTQMFAATKKMTETAVQAARTDALADMPSFVREMMVDSELSKDNPLMANPSYKPMVDHIKKQFQDKYPKATPAEINKGVRAYFDKMYSDMHEGKTKPEEVTNDKLLATGKDGADWLEWADTELPVEGQTTGSPDSLTLESQQ